MPLHNIIRVVPVSARKTSPPAGFSLYAVHTKKHTVIDHAPILFADDYKYYHVHSLGRDSIAPKDRTVTDDQGHSRRWRIHLGSITGSMLPQQLALATAQGSSAEDVVWNAVNQAVDNAIHELGAQGESAVTKASTDKFEMIADAIKTRLASDLGLTATITLRPAIDLKPVEHYETDEFQVKLHDMRADDTLRLRLEVDVQSPATPAEREKLIGKLPDREEITLAMQAATQTWLARHVSLNQFCFEEDAIRSTLMEQCQAVLPQGLDIISLSLHWLNPFRRDFPMEANRAVECKVQPNLTPMTIHHTLTVQLMDIAKWRKARVPEEDLARWIASRLDAITASVLSQKSYVEVMTDFTQVKEEIKAPFRQEMEAIGFLAKQHIAHTQNRELEKILETRTFDVETGDQEYPTKSGTVKFGLRAAAQIRLASLDKVKSFIEPNVDFKAPFIEALRSGASQAIRKLAPEALYAAFHEDSHDTQTQRTNGGSAFVDVGGDLDNAHLTADELIKKHIRQQLAAYDANQGDDFNHLSGKDIDLTFIPTAMDRIYSAIGPRVPKPLELEVEAQDEQGGETVTIENRYSLHMAPQGWNRFHAQCHNVLSDATFAASHPDERLRETEVAKVILKSIHELIKQNMEAKLSLMPLEFFVVPNAGGIRMAEAVALYGFTPELKAALQQNQDPKAQPDSVVARLVSDFGLRVESRGFRIKLTESQIKLRDLRVSAQEHKIAILTAVRDNERKAVDELLSDDRQLEERAKASAAAEAAAMTAVTQNSPLANPRENMRRIAAELSNVFNLGDGSEDSTETK